MGRLSALENIKNRNAQTASLNTRIRVKKKFNKSSPPKEMILAENKDPDEKHRTVQSFGRVRPQTKSYNKPYENLNNTFTPYYGKRAEISQKTSKKQFSLNSSNGYLSQAGTVSKPKSIEEWKRKHSKPRRNVIFNNKVVGVSKISEHDSSNSSLKL